MMAIRSAILPPSIHPSRALVLLAILCFFAEDIWDLGSPGNLARLGFPLWAASTLLR